VLRACRRLLRPGGHTAFFTIYIPAGLSRAERRHAMMAGPPAVSTRHDHHTLLATAGFGDIAETDVTADFSSTLHVWLEYASEREPDLRRAMGDELFDARRSDRRIQSAAVDAGVLRRSLFVADKPAR
jgi:hypothetical protein